LCIPREENNTPDVYVDDFKLLGRSEDDLENEIKIVQAVSKDMNMYFGLEICPRICLKNVGSRAKCI
jgi:hypothetical protein